MEVISKQANFRRNETSRVPQKSNKNTRNELSVSLPSLSYLDLTFPWKIIWPLGTENLFILVGFGCLSQGCDL